MGLRLVAVSVVLFFVLAARAAGATPEVPGGETTPRATGDDAFDEIAVSVRSVTTRRDPPAALAAIRAAVTWLGRRGMELRGKLSSSDLSLIAETQGTTESSEGRPQRPRVVGQDPEQPASDASGIEERLGYPDLGAGSTGAQEGEGLPKAIGNARVWSDDDDDGDDGAANSDEDDDEAVAQAEEGDERRLSILELDPTETTLGPQGSKQQDATAQATGVEVKALGALSRADLRMISNTHGTAEVSGATDEAAAAAAAAVGSAGEVHAQGERTALTAAELSLIGATQGTSEPEDVPGPAKPSTATGTPRKFGIALF